MSEPLLACKVGPLSCFCLWGEPVAPEVVQHEILIDDKRSEYLNNAPPPAQFATQQGAQDPHGDRFNQAERICSGIDSNGLDRTFPPVRPAEPAGKAPEAEAAASAAPVVPTAPVEDVQDAAQPEHVERHFRDMPHPYAPARHSSDRKPTGVTRRRKTVSLNCKPSPTKGESLRWLNLMLQKLWPRMDNAIQKIIYTKVTQAIQSKMPGPLKQLHFSDVFTLGQIPPRFNFVEVFRRKATADRPKMIEMRLGIEFKSDAEISLDAVLANVGIKNLMLQGELVVQFKPIIEHLPVVGGVSVFFLHEPKLDMEFTGLGSILQFPGFAEMFRQVLHNQIDEQMVFPNVIGVAIGTEEQGVDAKVLNSPQPIGVLRITVKSASGLEAKDTKLFRRASSDPFVRIRMSGEEWQSSTVKANCNPVWKDANVHDFLVYKREQRIAIHVFDEDVWKCDTLGHAEKISVEEALNISGQAIPLFKELGAQNKDSAGSVTCEFDFYQFVPLSGDCDGCVVFLNVDEIFLPAKLGQRVGLEATIGEVTKSTSMAKLKRPKVATEAVQEALERVARACERNKLEIEDTAFICGLSEHDVAEVLASMKKRKDCHVTAEKLEEQIIKQTIYDIHVEKRLAFANIDDKKLSSTDLRLELKGGSLSSTLGETMVNLKLALVSPGNTLKIESIDTEDGPVKAEVEVKVRGLQKSKLPSVFHHRSSGDSMGENDDEEQESLDWLNSILAGIWPETDKAMQRLIEEKVQPKIQEKMPKPLKGIHFDEFALGEEPPRFTGVTVSEVKHGIEVAVSVEFLLDSRVSIALGIASVGIQKLVFKGEVVCRLFPLLNESPVVGGMMIFLRESPQFDIEFSGVGSVLEFPGIAGLLHNVIENQIHEMLVFPHVIGVPISEEVDKLTLNTPSPLGILRVTAVSAQGLQGLDWHMFKPNTSDPYLLVKLCDIEWTSSTVKRTLSPRWKASDTHDFVVWSMDETVSIDVWDADTFKKDDFIGCIKPIKVHEAVDRSKASDEQGLQVYKHKVDWDNPDELPTEEDKCGTVLCKYEFFDMQQPDDGFQGNLSDAVAWIVSIRTDSILLPSAIGTAAGLKAIIGGKTQCTKIAKLKSPKVPRTAVTKAMNQVEQRCKAKNLDSQLIEKITDLSHPEESKDKEASNTVGTPIVTLDVCTRLFFTMKDFKELCSANAELHIVDKKGRSLGVHNMPLHKAVESPQRLYPLPNEQLCFAGKKQGPPIKARVQARVFTV